MTTYPIQRQTRDGLTFSRRTGDTRWNVFADDSTLLGYVHNNGARTTYGRHWTATAVDGTEVARTGTRQTAGAALARKAN